MPCSRLREHVLVHNVRLSNTSKQKSKKGANVKRLVLDASGIRATSKQAFEACRGQYELLVDENLVVELYTHREKKEAFSKEQAIRKAFEYFNKITSLPILKPNDPVRFEVEEGRSARECPHNCVLGLFQPSDADMERMRENESVLAKTFDFKHPSEHDADFQYFRHIRSNEELWPSMTERLNSVNRINSIRDRSIAYLMEWGRNRGWKVRNNYCPDREWWTFGAELTRLGYLWWKYARHGDNIPEPASPANSSYDMFHVAHMAICDGLLSTDKTMLNIAWACWPEKRDGLVTYDQSKNAIVPYEPSWQKS